MIQKGQVVTVKREWGSYVPPPEGVYAVALNSANNPWDQVRLTMTDGRRQWRSVAVARDLKVR